MTSYQQLYMDLNWKLWIWYGNNGSDMEIVDLVWKFQIWYGNFKSDMEIPNLIWKFLIWYGNSCFTTEIMDLIWNFWIWYGNSVSYMEIPNLIRKFLIRYGNPDFLGPEECDWWIFQEIHLPPFQIFQILVDLPSKLFTSLLYILRPSSPKGVV